MQLKRSHCSHNSWLHAIKKNTSITIFFLLFLLPMIAFCQLPEITGTAIDTSGYSFVRIQIRMESLILKNDSTNGERYFKRAQLYRKIEAYQLALKDYI